jgi:hypothetical protein
MVYILLTISNTGRCTVMSSRKGSVGLHIHVTIKKVVKKIPGNAAPPYLKKIFEIDRP